MAVHRENMQLNKENNMASARNNIYQHFWAHKLNRSMQELTPDEIEEKLSQFTIKHVNDDNPAIITYEINYRKRTLTLKRSSDGWIPIPVKNTNEYTKPKPIRKRNTNKNSESSEDS